MQRHHGIFIISLPKHKAYVENNPKNKHGYHVWRSPTLRCAASNAAIVNTANVENSETYLREEVNSASPAMLRKIPTKSNFSNTSHDNGSEPACVFGVVKIDETKNTK